MSNEVIVNSTDMWINSLYYYLFEYWDKNGDPRVLDWPLMSGGPWKIMPILITYILFVAKFGPKWMSNRKPFELRGIKIVYYISLNLINVIYTYQPILWLDYGSQLLNFKLPDNRDRSEETMAMIRMAYYYSLSKFFNMIPLIFKVLEKNKIPWIVIFHHVTIPIITWLSIWVCRIVGQKNL